MVPDVTTAAATDVKPYGATLNGAVKLDKAGSAKCWFVWGTTKAFGHRTPCEPEEVSEPPEESAVHATLSPATDSELQPDTTYYYRLQATNHSEITDPGKESQDQQFTTTGPTEEASVSDVASSSATLNATIDPHERPTTYYFQYGTASTTGCEANPSSCTSVPAAPGEAVGSGDSAVTVKPLHVDGLLAGTVYHYRVVAVSDIEVAAGQFEEATFDSPDQTFTPQLSGSVFALPDGRQWEMVSPPNKYGALIEPDDGPAVDVTEASVDGGAFTYVTTAPTESVPRGNTNYAQNFSIRSSDGWSNQDIATPNGTATGVTVGNGQEYRFFSPDLSRAIAEPFGADTTFTPISGEETSPEATERTPYVREDFTCRATPATCYTPLLTEADVAPGVKFGEGPERDPEAFVGATPDLSHVVLQTNMPLTGTSAGLFEWAAGHLQLVSVLPEAEGGRPASSSVYGGAEPTTFGSETRNAISEDGSRIIWSTTSNPGALYMRDTVTQETVRLDLPKAECLKEGTCGSEKTRPHFDMASSDESRVFFTDTQRLTADSRGRDLGSTEEPDLYVCQMVEVEEAGQKKLKCDLTDLTPDSNPDGENADVQDAILDASEDGSYVYFVADGVLGDGAEHGATPGNCRGSDGVGVCNLYVVHYDGSEWEEPTFITALSGADSDDWRYGELLEHTSRSSPDGRYLAFMSQQDLTGYDTADVVGDAPDEEVYLYHAETSPSGMLESGKLVCASCNPTGARPVGELEPAAADPLVDARTLWTRRWLAADVPGWTGYGLGTGASQPRYLSDSGRLFFNSHEALVPEDVNGTWDVYEYEPPGVGACTVDVLAFSERSGGCVGLISAGESAEESAFLDASESGGDVFFLTLSQLAPQDYDHSLDVYDARECSSESPCFPTPARTAAVVHHRSVV